MHVSLQQTYSVQRGEGYRVSRRVLDVSPPPRISLFRLISFVFLVMLLLGFPSSCFWRSTVPLLGEMFKEARLTSYTACFAFLLTATTSPPSVIASGWPTKTRRAPTSTCRCGADHTFSGLHSVLTSAPCKREHEAPRMLELGMARLWLTFVDIAYRGSTHNNPAHWSLSKTPSKCGCNSASLPTFGYALHSASCVCSFCLRCCCAGPGCGQRPH